MAIIIMVLERDKNLRNALINDFNLFSWTSRERTYALLSEKSGPCKIPNILLNRNYVLLLSLKEYGSSGLSQIVCGIKGQPLSSFLIQKGKAYFKSSRRLMTINYYTNKEGEEEIQIRKHILKKQGTFVFIETQVLYTGDPSPPYHLRSFDLAAKKAVERAKIYGSIDQPLYIANK